MSNVTNASGIQMQFHKRPESVYEKRLAGINAGANSAAAELGPGMRLAQALGVLGDQVNAFMGQQEKDREKVGIAEAERLLQSTSEEDLKKKTALDLLAIDGSIPTAANPYAVAMIEKMRGKYIASRARMSYETEVLQVEGKAKTSEEEVARYNRYIQDHAQEGLGLTSDQTAFQAGFWDNHIVDQTKVADNWLKEQSKELDVIRRGSAAATLREGSDTWMTTDIAPLKEHLNTTFASDRLAAAPIEERIALMKDWVQDWISTTGDYAKLKEILEGVELGTDPKDPSKMVKAVEVLGDTEKYKHMAVVRTSQIHGERIQNDVKALLEMSPAEMNQKYTSWMEDDPQHFNTMLGYREGILKEHERREQKKLIAQARAGVDQSTTDSAFKILDAQAQAVQGANIEDAFQNPTASSFSDLPKFKYMTLDSSGNAVEKEYSWSKGLVNKWSANKARTIMQDQSLSPEQRDLKLLEHLALPFADSYRDSWKLSVKTQLDNINVSRLATSPNGLAFNDPELQQTFQMYQTSPEKTKDVIGSELTQEIAALSVLSNTLGDPKQAVTLYAQAKDKLSNPELRRDILKDVEVQLSGASLKGFTSISGQEVRLDITLMSNRDTADAVRSLASMLVAGGQSPSAATQNAINEVRKSTFVYRDTAVPRSIFRFNTDSERLRGEIGERVLDKYRADFIKDTGIEADNVHVDFDTKRNVFIVRGGYGFKSYSVAQIVQDGNALLAAQGSGQGGRNVTLSEIESSRNSTVSYKPNDDPEFGHVTRGGIVFGSNGGVNDY